jgi:hypothetical protein
MILNWQITRVFPSVRMAGYAPWAPPPGLPARSVLRPVVGLRRVRQGRVQLGNLLTPPLVAPFTLFTPAVTRIAPGRRRNGRVSIGSLLSPQAPFVLFANPVVRSIRPPRCGSSTTGVYLSQPPALPFTLFASPLIRSVRRPRPGSAWMARLAWPQPTVTTVGRYYTDPNRASAVLISTADLGYAQTDPNSATVIEVRS